MRAAFSETLTGGAYPLDPSRGVQPLALDLKASARGVVECALGAPFEIRGHLRAEPPTTPAAALLPAAATVTGTMRFLVSAGLFYDLRLAASDDTPACDKLELRGARRFARGDLVTSATTFVGMLLARGAVIGDVHLRFHVRDDVPSLFRSLRLGS